MPTAFMGEMLGRLGLVMDMQQAMEYLLYYLELGYKARSISCKELNIFDCEKC